MPCEDILNDLDEHVVRGAKLLSVHDFNEEIEYKDPRFVELDQPGFGVVMHTDSMYMRISPVTGLNTLSCAL